MYGRAWALAQAMHPAIKVLETAAFELVVSILHSCVFRV